MEMDDLPNKPLLIPKSIGDCSKLEIFSTYKASIVGELSAASLDNHMSGVNLSRALAGDPD